MLKASYREHDNEEEIDQAKFDEYLPSSKTSKTRRIGRRALSLC